MKNDSHNDTQHDFRAGDERSSRVGLITRVRRQARRNDEERARILAESFEPGANIAAVARRHGIRRGLLHAWRQRAKAEAAGSATPQAPLFIPVTVADAPNAVHGKPRMGEASPGSLAAGRMIEIETAGSRVHVPEGVDAKTLSIVLAALRRAS